MYMSEDMLASAIPVPTASPWKRVALKRISATPKPLTRSLGLYTIILYIISGYARLPYIKTPDLLRNFYI